MLLREEQKPLEDFFQAKNLKIRNEMLDDVSHHHLFYFQVARQSCPCNCNERQYPTLTITQSSALIQAALNDADIASSDEEVVAARADRGSADEDSESADEDFQSGSDSDVAEEYDSAHESSGSGTDAEMADGGGGGSDNEKAVEPKKKKVKTSN